MAGDKKLLQVKDLLVSYKVYEGLLRVLNGVNLCVREGERVGLIGETGCGKTTILKTIVMIVPMPPARLEGGVVFFKGTDIHRDRKAGIRSVRKGVSMILQDPTAALNPTLSVRTFMADVLKGKSQRMSKAERNSLMQEALEKVAMPFPERVLDSYPVQLSGGMRQRVCIALALLKDVDLLLADEPTTSLDVTIEEQILELLNDLIQGSKKSTILVSHALGAIRKMTDRVYVMYAGDIAESGPAEALFEQPFHPYTRGLFAATPRLTGAGISDGIAGEIPSYLYPPRGCRFSPRCPERMPLCDEEKPPVFQPQEQREVSCHLYASLTKSES